MFNLDPNHTTLGRGMNKGHLSIKDTCFDRVLYFHVLLGHQRHFSWSQCVHLPTYTLDHSLIIQITIIIISPISLSRCVAISVTLVRETTTTFGILLLSRKTGIYSLL